MVDVVDPSEAEETKSRPTRIGRRRSSRCDAEHGSLQTGGANCRTTRPCRALDVFSTKLTAEDPSCLASPIVQAWISSTRSLSCHHLANSTRIDRSRATASFQTTMERSQVDQAVVQGELKLRVLNELEALRAGYSEREATLMLQLGSLVSRSFLLLVQRCSLYGARERSCDAPCELDIALGSNARATNEC